MIATSLKVGLPEPDVRPPERLDDLSGTATQTDPEAHRDVVLPLMAALYEKAHMAAAEMAAFDLEWAEGDLPATLDVLPAE